jgi:hypothetical protein
VLRDNLTKLYRNYEPAWSKKPHHITPRAPVIMAMESHETLLEVSLGRSPHIQASRPVNTACCCGRSSCVYLIHNNAVLSDLEKDVRTAAQLGQVSIILLHWIALESLSFNLEYNNSLSRWIRGCASGFLGEVRVMRVGR